MGFGVVNTSLFSVVHSVREEAVHKGKALEKLLCFLGRVKVGST